MPSSLTFQYLPVKGRSVPCRRSTSYCSGLSSSRHWASVLSTLGVVIDRAPVPARGTRRRAASPLEPLGQCHMDRPLPLDPAHRQDCSARHVGRDRGRRSAACPSPRAGGLPPPARPSRAGAAHAPVRSCWSDPRSRSFPSLDVTSPLPAYRYAMPTAVIVGAGVFGSSLARQLAISGWEVTLVEQESPGWAGSSSGGESRLMRFSHGSDRWYTRSAWRARALWREIDPTLMSGCGVAWFAYGDQGWEADSERTLREESVPVERLEPQ